jgi:hypothetical protein
MATWRVQAIAYDSFNSITSNSAGLSPVLAMT